MSANQFEITRRIEIDAAHRIPDHKSKCFNIHGHRYIVEATCVGPLLSGEQEGMIFDFGFLKQCMIDVIHDPCDHGAIFYYKDPMLQDLMPNWQEQDFVNNLHNVVTTGSGWKLCFLETVPTAENLARYWYYELQGRINQFFASGSTNPPELKCIDVWETPNCRARYPS